MAGPFHKMDDLRLCLQIRDGSEDAVRALLKRHEGLVLYAMKITYRWWSDYSLAKQDATVAMWRASLYWKPSIATFGTYSTKAMIGAIKRGSSMKGRGHLIRVDGDPNPPTPTPDPDTQEMWTAAAKLPPNLQDFLRLRLNGAPFKVVGELIGNASKQRAHQIEVLLKGQLQALLHGSPPPPDLTEVRGGTKASRWLRSENRFIREYYRSMTDKQLTERLLNRTLSAVQRHRRGLGLFRGKSRKPTSRRREQ